MKVFIVLCSIVAVALAQNQPVDESPKPYSFNYVAEGDEGSSSHEESGDGTGTVRGTYTLSLVDGRNRVVEYVADAAGFRANIRTNEPGTDNAAPADVTIESTAEGAGAYAAPVKPQVAAAVAAPAAAAGARAAPAQAAAPGSQQNVRYVLVPATQ